MKRKVNDGACESAPLTFPVAAFLTLVVGSAGAVNGGSQEAYFGRDIDSRDPVSSAVSMIDSTLVDSSHSLSIDPGYVTRAREFDEEPRHFPAFAFRIGDLTIASGVRASLLHDSNILLSAEHEQEDLVQIYKLRLKADIGDRSGQSGNYLSMVYIPSLTHFREHSEEDSADHEISLSGRHSRSRWTAQSSLRYQHLSENDREVGGRTTRDVLASYMEIRMPLSPATWLEVEGSTRTEEYESALNWKEFRAQGWIVYPFPSRLEVSAGSAVGWLLPEANSDQIFQQILLRARYTATLKLKFAATAGVEYRQFQEGYPNQRTTPVFSMKSIYSPPGKTVLGAELYRRVQSSVALRDQNFISTGLALFASRPLLLNTAVEMEAGYERDSYYATTRVAGPERSDGVFFARSSVGYSISNVGTRILYCYRTNESNFHERSYADQQVGVEVSWGF